MGGIACISTCMLACLGLFFSGFLLVSAALHFYSAAVCDSKRQTAHSLSVDHEWPVREEEGYID